MRKARLKRFSQKRNMEDVTQCVSIMMKIPSEQMFTKTRERHIVDCRRIVFAVIKKVFGYTFTAIGKHFNKHHATILHSLKQHDCLMLYDFGYKKMYEEILENVLSSTATTQFLLHQKQEYYMYKLQKINKQIKEENEKHKEKNRKTFERLSIS